MNTVQQITSDIYRIAIPVPFKRLGTVNCYLLQDQSGWFILDTGVNTPQAQLTWQAALAELNISPANISRIILTHIHADHFGLAGWLQQLTHQAGANNVPVCMSPHSIETADMVWKQGWQTAMDVDSFWTRAGIPSLAQQNWNEAMDFMRQAMMPYPDDIEPIYPNDELIIGTRHFRLLETNGHSEGHLALYDEADQLILIGDQVLPHITPNIGLWPGAPRDPLHQYLQSLYHLKSLAVRLALPGHGDPITQWPDRIQAIIDHHQLRLVEMAQVVGAGASAYDVSLQTFASINAQSADLQFAVSETLAHLDYLVYQNRLERYDNGVWWYKNFNEYSQ